MPLFNHPPNFPRDTLLVVLFVLFLIFYFFWPPCGACGILVPRLGIKPGPTAVKAWSPNHWTTREFHLLVCCWRDGDWLDVQPTLEKHQRNLNRLRIELSHNQFSSEKDRNLTSQLHSISFIISVCLSFNCFVSQTQFIRNKFGKENLQFTPESGRNSINPFTCFIIKSRILNRKTHQILFYNSVVLNLKCTLNTVLSPTPDLLKQNLRGSWASEIGKLATM